MAARAAPAATLLAVALSLAPLGRAWAGNDLALRVGPVESVGDVVCVSYHAAEPFTPRLIDTLFRGMPATISIEVGVWKRRTFWFDKLVLALKSEHKVIYDPWAREFRVRSGANPPRDRSVAGLDSLEAMLFDERRLPLATVASLDSTASHYVSVKILIRPLSAEDLGEVEHWLAGDARPPEESPQGVPRYLLNLAVSLSGLGDRTSLQKSQSFVPARLPIAP
jgi:uncharacterized protein DUF4390